MKKTSKASPIKDGGRTVWLGCLYLSESSAGWSLSGQHAPVCKHNRVSLMVLEVGVCPWDGSQVELVIGWPLPQSLSLPSAYITCR